MNALYLAADLVEELIAHAAAHNPEEACGLLAGIENRARGFYPVENILHSPTAFEMDPLQQVRAMLAMETKGLELVAICHSHPSGPPWPSSMDVAQAYYPDSAQIIISLADPARPVMRAFTIRDGLVSEITMAEVSDDERTAKK